MPNNKVVKRPIYNIVNQAQINALTQYVAEHRGVFMQTLVEVLRYVNDCELTSILNTKREDAINYVECGVFILNKYSSRRLNKRMKISFELDISLRRAIELSNGHDYLFQSLLCDSNRAQSCNAPVTRQSVWGMFYQATEAVEKATKDSGISKLGVLTPSSLLKFEQGSHTMLGVIDDLITSYGDDLSSNLLKELHSEYVRLTED